MTSHYESLGPELLVTSHGSVRIVTLNAPDRLNSVDDDLHSALIRVWQFLEDDGDAAAVVLTGAGRAFCAGGHFPNFVRNHRDYDARRRDLRHAERLVREMMQFEIPVVAAVNGPAIGLGASLAVMCDIVVMSDEAFMADPHVNVGVVAGDGGAVLWPLLTSLLKAKEFLLLGDRIPAEDCVRLGLANRLVPRSEVFETSVAIAQRLASQPRRAVRDTKRVLNQHAQQAMLSSLTLGAVTERESFSSEDVLMTVERLEQGGTTT